MTTAFITHSDCLLHEMGRDHPEGPTRLSAITDGLKAANLYDFLDIYEAPQGFKL
jgi:acetoin utilization deacetylase AcuC-like enzyme